MSANSRRAAVIVIALWSATALAERQSTPARASSRSFDAANDSWERGDYIDALNGYIQLLTSPGGDQYLEPIALTTGELFRTHEITPDGRAPRFSPDGKFIVYETGLETSRRTRILRNDATRAQVADLPGVSATFSPPLAQVAYLKIPDNDEIRRASAALAAASPTAQNRGQLTQMLAWLVAKHAAIVVRDLTTGREMELPAPDLLKTGLTFSADGRLLYFLGGKESETDRTEIYVISELAPKPVLVVETAGLKSAPVVDPAGKVLLYTVPTQNPLRRPAEPRQEGARGFSQQEGARGFSQQEGARGFSRAETGRAGGAGRAGEPGGPGRGSEEDREEPVAPRLPQQAMFAIVDLASHRASTIIGSAPTVSGDGKTLAYVARNGSDYALMLGPTTGTQTTSKTTPQRLDAPALSADGSRVAFQQMVRDDWEIFVSNRDGSGEQRVTREIQHDLLPRFLSPDRLLAVMGEPRHRRSYLYDLLVPAECLARATQVPATCQAPRRTRLFHNNTVRTIAPEYQWSPSPDGTQILIGAERDGNTVSPERGVYLVDLKTKVTKAAVLERLRANLKTETALKAAAVHAFAPIAADVKRVLALESPARVFSYEKALFDFDSKHISRPGNRMAAEYLFDTFKSFGYEPEYQTFEARNALDGKTSNVIATLRGTANPELVYVVSSHFDSVEAGPGADDDASGTAALLEAARVLHDHPLPATVIFALFTGEESGLAGSREFVRRASASKMHVVGALNNDMVGWRNDSRLDNTIRYSNAGIRDIQHAAAMLFTRLITYDALYFKGTDAVSLYDAFGDVVGGIGSYPVLGSPHYHQASDVLELEDHQLITETSKTTVATVMLLASSPSRLTGLRLDSFTTASATLSWTPSPEKGVASYIVDYGPPANPRSHRLTVTQPTVTIPQLAAGNVVSVKAVNAHGLEGWDWATLTVGRPRISTSAF